MTELQVGVYPLLVIYLASTYTTHFTEDTTAQDLFQNRHTYTMHNTLNHTQLTYRVHTTSHKENQLHTRSVSFIYNCIFNNTNASFFVCTSIRIFVYLLPTAYCSLYLAFALIGNFFHSRNRKNLVVYPTCFHLNLYATLGNTEEDK